MSWWSTVIGGAVGFMIGGPLGAMLGVAFAGNLSKRKSQSGLIVILVQEISSEFRQPFLVVSFQSWVTSLRWMERSQNQRLFSLNK